MRVILTRSHPWSGYTGEKLDEEGPMGMVRVRLDNGHEVFAGRDEMREVR